MHKRYPSSLHEKGAQLSRSSSHASGTHLTGYSTSSIVAMDKGATISSESSLPSSMLLLQSKATGRHAERSIESVLSSSKQKVSAIESLLKGVGISGRQNFSAVRSTSLDLGVDPPSSRDPHIPLAAPASDRLSLQGSALLDSSLPSISIRRNGGSRLVDAMPQVDTKERSRSPYSHNLSSEPMSDLSVPYLRRSSGRSQDDSITDESNDTWPRPNRRSPQMHTDKHFTDMPYRDASYRNPQNNHVPHFQRPLRKQVASRVSVGVRHSFDDGHVPSNDMSGYTDGPASLNEALSEGLSPSSDWVARVAAFNFVQTLLQLGQKGIQEITQNFEKVMKLFFRYLDDPHHKVAQAAFSTLADIIPACKKPFESYVERILPYVFSRLIDPKELVSKPCSSTLEVVGRTYAVDTLLPAIVRSLDEQRSPKAKLAVLEFANKSFSKYKVDSEGYSNSGFLKLWLSKLAPLIHEKNAKLKETSIKGIISVYSHFDSTAVLNFILNLSIEEQNLVRRSLKQYTPRIEVDLVNYLQSKKERSRPKSYEYEQIDFGTSEDGYNLTSRNSYPFGRVSASSFDNESGKRMHAVQDVHTDHANQCFEPSSEAEIFTASRESKSNARSVVEAARSWADYPEKSDATIDDENSVGTPRQDFGRHVSDGHNNAAFTTVGKNMQDMDQFVDLSSVKVVSHTTNSPSIPQLLHQISNDGEVSSQDKQDALQQLVQASANNDNSIWTKILTTLLEVLDDSDSSVRELSLSLVAEMLRNQKDQMEESIEIILEKLVQMTKDVVAKISNEANQCLNVVLAKYDPFRCLAVIVPLLVTDDEKTLVMCINCLTKATIYPEKQWLTVGILLVNMQLVGRLSQEELVAQLPSFLPALFDAFSNQSPDIRKTVVFCLVDIYIMLGKAFVPYLEGLSSTQLRLVTIYANRISQARNRQVVLMYLAPRFCVQEFETDKYNPASLEWGLHPDGEVEVAAQVVADVKEEKMMSSNLIEPFGRGRGVGFGPGESYDRFDGRTEGNLPVGNWRFNGIYEEENKVLL
uniref:CLIP-associating protein 1 n=1 Tax=Aegilops tauschii TaxID=37682 RepID=M8CRL2_AEGTA